MSSDSDREHSLANEADDVLRFDSQDTLRILDPETLESSGPSLATGDSDFRQVCASLHHRWYSENLTC